MTWYAMCFAAMMWMLLAFSLAPVVGRAIAMDHRRAGQANLPEGSRPTSRRLAA